MPLGTWWPRRSGPQVVQSCPQVALALVATHRPGSILGNNAGQG
jgi:hypothetical protein